MLPRVVDHSIAGAVYAGIGVGLRVASLGLGAVAATGRGPRLDASRPGRFLSRSVIGLVGDRLARERPTLAWPMSLRRGGADVAVNRASLAAHYPAASPDLVVFLPGLCEDETAWDRHADRYGTTYPEALAAAGWSPLMLRANTGLAVKDNGALLATLLADVVDAWPVEVARVALVGHSMGGLVARVACALDAAGPVRWSPLVTDVVTLGTPHLGAPLAGWARSGSAGLARLPETSAFGRIIDTRSAGILDLERGLDLDAAPALPHARMRLVSGSLGRPAHPWVGWRRGRLVTSWSARLRPPEAGGCSRTPICSTWRAPTTSASSTIPTYGGHSWTGWARAPTFGRLEQILGRGIDLISYGGLSPHPTTTFDATRCCCDGHQELEGVAPQKFRSRGWCRSSCPDSERRDDVSERRDRRRVRSPHLDRAARPW